jgi:diguanylate cyclase (GGDEF)-like protein
LQVWIREHLELPRNLEASLLEAVDAVFSRHERLWQESKQEAIQVVSACFAEKMAEATHELREKDATVNNIATYFEQLVADLTDKSQRDPKTKLMNFASFTEQLESFLEFEQRGRWCAVGLVDITSFKWYNDALGHAVGDRIIMRVAQLLREQVRSQDLLAQERIDRRVRELHARFGGDEFCFLIPDLAEYRLAYVIGERFRQGVERYDWSLEDHRLAERPVKVDVGVVCLRLGRVAERRGHARRMADALIQRADELMYEAKSRQAGQIRFLRARIENGRLIDMTGESPRGSAATETRRSSMIDD